MIKHIVIWKLKETAEGKTKVENMQTIKSMLENLVGKINEIAKLEVGVNFNSSHMAFDLALYSEFNDEQGLEIYQKHPEHLKVRDFVGKVTENRAVVDYIV